MNSDIGRHRGRRRAGVLAALVVMALLMAACGRSTSTGAGGSSSAGASTLHQEELAVARCMRSHGVPNFPDPPANGDIPNVSPDSLGVSSSVYQSALNACRHLAPDATSPSRAQLQQMLSKLLQFAKCMRSHGVQNFPDPDSVGLRVPHSMTQLPQYQRAYQACKSLLPRNAPVKDAAPGGAVVVVAGAGAAGAWYAGAFDSDGSPGPASASAPPVTQPVQREDLAATTPVNATLGYAGSYTVTGKGGGTLTWLPSPGQVIGQGQVLYKTGNGSPVVLLYGAVPDWRAMSAGTTGADVSQLNHDLVRLGDADSADIAALGWDYFSWETRAGVENLQSDLGVSSPPGSLSLGQVVFEPAVLRISQVTGSLGGPMSGPVLTATSDQHVVTIALDASQQSEVKAGDTVSITLPDGKTTPGTVSSVGTVATASSGSGSTPTIPVTVKLTHPQAAGSLDQAPVTVNITTGSVRNVLAVPVGALLAQSSGAYAVEVVGAGNPRRLVPVTPGIIDDADGLVQVSGALRPGQRVVVPAS